MEARLLILCLLLAGCSAPLPSDPRQTLLNAPASNDGLAEVNAARAKRGLQPFARDEQLETGARRLAEYRALHRMEGHTANDFDFLPEGCGAKATGCGALKDSWGWGTCCTYDDYKYAGAAWARGSDGRRYMHLVVK